MGIFSDVLLTVDYDRTLTAPDSTIPERNIEAIRYFIENGGAFTINTGRSVPMTKVFRDKVPVNAPLLLYNGSAAYDLAEKKLTFCHAIAMDLWETVRRCEELFPDLTVEVQGIDAHYRFSENPMWDAFSVHQNCAHAFAHPGDDLGTFLKFALYGEFRDVTVADMFTSIAGEKQRMDDVEETLRREFGDYCEVFRSATRIIDIHAKGVSKAKSARQLQQQLGRNHGAAGNMDLLGKYFIGVAGVLAECPFGLAIELKGVGGDQFGDQFLGHAICSFHHEIKPCQTIININLYFVFDREIGNPSKKAC